jgi:hypothetical protein
LVDVAGLLDQPLARTDLRGLPGGDVTDQSRFLVGFAFEEFGVAAPHRVAERPRDDARDLGAEVVVDGQLRPRRDRHLAEHHRAPGSALDVFALRHRLPDRGGPGGRGAERGRQHDRHRDQADDGEAGEREAERQSMHERRIRLARTDSCRWDAPPSAI